ncbi:MAG: S8 family serine peptidase [Desulfobacterales bacterium]|nr:S8 family serine peptidase [Desulfobacterales bacterium]
MTPEIAIIDSGITPGHPHVGPITGGHGYETDPNTGQVAQTRDLTDNIGHGTAIAGIIKEKVPDARLYAVKIFSRDLGTSVEVLTRALAWCVRQRFNIIHLSLGVENKDAAAPLEQLCDTAREKGTLIIASARGPEHRIYPACFSNVVCAYRHPDCAWDDLVFHSGSAVAFGAHGFPRPIPGLPQEKNFQGHSFAAAHVTAHAAALMKQYPDYSLETILRQLQNSAQ